MSQEPQYDIALSFAGEQRTYVSGVAELLWRKGVSVFYDEFEEAELWGKNLYTYLRDVYKNRARFTVIFCSQAYANKLWPKHERESAQERAFQEAGEYILPVRFDDAEIPGLPSTVAYLDARRLSQGKIVSLLLVKLGRKQNLKGWTQRVKRDPRFSDAQFDAYRNVWAVLQTLKAAGDALWEEAKAKNMIAFAKVLKQADATVSAHAIFFREDDYSQLKTLFQHFFNYKIGKQSLIETSSDGTPKSSPWQDEIPQQDIEQSIALQIARNRSDREKYNQLLDQMRQMYRGRLSGGHA
jgi:hypothetical protein